MTALWIVFLAKREDLLELETRRRLFEAVTGFPGLHLRELARQLGLDPNHAKYHLTYLEKHGLVSSKKEEGYWRFFPREAGSVGLRDVVSVDKKRVLSFLRRPVPLHTVLILLDRGRATQGELAAVVGVAQATLHYHLGKMEASGLVVSRREGRERVYELPKPDEILELLVRYRPPDALVQGFLDAWEQLEL
ncbi:MAG: helix-turn-helix domain-containing protein [Euryarchaeota archaeon]|nr:helix-turn-helix domain-containing protein [Euryarchaeota archaeon]